MLDPILLALSEKILTVEADRHGFGWTALPTQMHVISVDGRFLRHQAVPRPYGLVHTDPPHLQAAAYAAAALSVAGVPVAACLIGELCPGCLSSQPPRRIRRLWHSWRHQPTVRVLVAVDVAGARYYLQRDRDDDSDVVLYISTPPEPGGDSDGEPAVLLYRAMVDLLATWRASAGREEGDVDVPSGCQTPGRAGDPDCGDGWDGLCGEGVDCRHTAGRDDEQPDPAARGNPPGTMGSVHSG